MKDFLQPITLLETVEYFPGLRFWIRRHETRPLIFQRVVTEELERALVQRMRERCSLPYDGRERISHDLKLNSWRIAFHWKVEKRGLPRRAALDYDELRSLRYACEPVVERLTVNGVRSSYIESHQLKDSLRASYFVITVVIL